VKKPASGWQISGVVALVTLALALNLRAEDAPVDDDTSPYHQALVAYKTGHYADARTAIDAAEKSKPGDVATEVLKARILTEQGDYAAGEKLLRPYLTSGNALDVQLALGDLLLRKHSAARATKYYMMALQTKPNDPDIILKLIYAEVNASNLVDAEKNASLLKPQDPDHPSYYFAEAALAEATGKTDQADQDIEQSRTIYGITVTNRYLKTYLQVFSSKGPNPEMTPPPLSPK
jgi:predicted Zn-dependent protease